MRLFTTSGKLKQVLRGSAMGLVAAFALASCSGPGTGTHAAAPAAAKAAKVTATKEPEAEAGPRRLRLMTQEQYLNTLAYVFGPDIKPETHFAPVQRTDGLLANGTARAGVTDSQLELFQKTAALVAGMVVKPERRDFLIMCKPADEKAADKACAGKFLADIGRLLYRQPMKPAKVNELVEQASVSADKLKDFYAGLAVAIEAMLVSPNVLYIAETSEPDPKRPGHLRLDAYSLASRLSFFLWNAAPDDAMLKAADSGEILTDKGKARIVNMMLASPRLETGMRAFFDDMFAFDDFNNLAKDPMVYPSFTGVTTGDAREQTLRTVIDQLITKNKDYRDLYTTRETYMSPSLAALYRLPSTRTWAPYEFPADSPRSGLLTQISFLAVHSHPGRSSATLRGKALRELFLCQKVPPPPPNVDFSAVEDPKSPFKTARERVGFHLKNPVCAGCHKITDPMGLALENFDGGGQFRADEKGTPIDVSGTLDGKNFADLAGLSVALHDHPQLPNCLVKRVYSYSTGGPLTNTDDAVIAALDKSFATAGYRLPELMRAIAVSDTFSRVIETPAPQVPEKSASMPAAHAPAAQ